MNCGHFLFPAFRYTYCVSFSLWNATVTQLGVGPLDHLKHSERVLNQGWTRTLERVSALFPLSVLASNQFFWHLLIVIRSSELINDVM